MRNGQSLFIAFVFGGSSYPLPHGKGFSRLNEQAIDMGDCQREVGGLILLQLHIDITKSATNERLVGIDENGQRLVMQFAGEPFLAQEVLHVAFQNFLLHGQSVRKWRYFTK